MQANNLELLAKARKNSWFFGFDVNVCNNYEIRWALRDHFCAIDSRTCKVFRCKIDGKEIENPGHRALRIISDRISYLARNYRHLAREND